MRKKILQDWNKADIRYCVLRNYESLNRARDLDVSIHKEDLKKAERVLFQHDFVKKSKQFDRSHQGYFFIDQNLNKHGFDIQINGVHWNNMPYLGKEIFQTRKREAFFYTLSETDEYIMYLCHSLLGKRHFKDKYKSKIVSLNINKKKAFEKLSNIFSKKQASWLMQKVSERKFEEIQQRKNSLIASFIFKKKRFLNFIPTIFRWIWYKEMRMNPIIACIGPDGSGKTTATQTIAKALGKRAEIAYFGRGKKNIIPIKKAASIVKKREQKVPKSFKKLIYTFACPLYACDLLLRYWITIFFKRFKKIILTDRYGTDMLLFPQIPTPMKKFFFLFFSKPSSPTITLYLYADTTTLYKRKRQQSIQELDRQKRLFSYAAKKLNAIPINTNKVSPKRISRIAIAELAKKGFY